MRWAALALRSTISRALPAPVCFRPRVSLAATTATMPRPSRRTSPTLPLSIFQASHGVLAGQAGIGVGEAGAGIDITGAGLDILAGDPGGTYRRGGDNQGESSEQKPASH